MEFDEYGQIINQDETPEGRYEPSEDEIAEFAQKLEGILSEADKLLSSYPEASEQINEVLSSYESLRVIPGEISFPNYWSETGQKMRAPGNLVVSSFLKSGFGSRADVLFFGEGPSNNENFGKITIREFDGGDLVGFPLDLASPEGQTIIFRFTPEKKN